MRLCAPPVREIDRDMNTSDTVEATDRGLRAGAART
jgi:hypothetical protein